MMTSQTYPKINTYYDFDKIQNGLVLIRTGQEFECITSPFRIVGIIDKYQESAPFVEIEIYG